MKIHPPIMVITVRFQKEIDIRKNLLYSKGNLSYKIKSSYISVKIGNTIESVTIQSGIFSGESFKVLINMLFIHFQVAIRYYSYCSLLLIS